MSMVVQHNLTAMNANRMLGITTGKQAKSAEKLSSGYRINRAADDAAGLSISEKMRKQIRGLTQASSNAQDGISAVQTAEGALSETQSMLQRMNELATQAANGTNSETDKQSIQDEIDQLLTEIDRVSETTKFNEIYLLKGDAAGAKATTYSYSTQASVSNTDLYVASGASFVTVAAGSLLEDGKTYYSSLTDQIVGEKIDFTKGAIVGTKIDFTTTPGSNMITDTDVLASDYYMLSGSVYVEVKSGAAYDSAATYYTLETLLGGNVTYSAVASSSVSTATGSVFTTSVYDKDGNTVASGAVYDSSATYFSSVSQSKDTISYVSARVNINTDILYTKNGSGYTKVEKGTEYNSAAVYYTMAAVTGAGVSQQAVAVATMTSYTTAGYVAATTIYDKDGKTVASGTAIDTAATFYSTISKATVGVAVSNMDAVKTSSSDFQFMDKFGNEIAANGLYRYFDDDGAYKGGLYTKNADGEFTAATTDTVNAYVETGESSIGVLKFSLQVGADATTNNQIDVEIEAMNTEVLGIKALKVTGGDNTNARNAIETIDAALKKVSEQRSALGAVQNRLEHTIANLDNIVENTTSAESKIRDVDMASEMVEYSKNNILAQAGQSMLAQANQSNQGVLSLLG